MLPAHAFQRSLRTDGNSPRWAEDPVRREKLKTGAGEAIRTPDINLGKVALYP